MSVPSFCRWAVLAVLLIAVGSANGQSAFPGEDWSSIAADDTALESFGYDVDQLRSAARLARDNSSTTGLMVIDRGQVVLQYGDVQELSYIASVRKSILAMLYGKYLESGRVSLDKTLQDLGFDDVLGLSERERGATIRDLIAARSGVYHPASNGGDNSSEAPARGTQEPGSYFLYNNWDFNAAGAAFEAETGLNIYDAVMMDLAGPIGMQDFDRDEQRKSGDLDRSRYPAYHMWFSTRDMARIGLLMLNEGNWNGRQVIPKEWAQQIVSVVTPIEEMNPIRNRNAGFGYGYMWWVWDGPQATGPWEGAYTARGAYGQYITVLPAMDLVIAHKTNAAYRRTTTWSMYREIMEQIVSSRRMSR